LELLEDRLTPTNYTAGNAAQLAAAIVAADNTQSTITLTASFQLTSDLTIGNTSGLTIDGAGNTLTAAANSGLFIVSSGANVTFQNVTLTGGNATPTIGTTSYLGGGAIEDLGGNVTLSGAKVTNNKINGVFFGAEVGGAAADGGGVFVSNGTLTIRNSSFSNNVAQGNNGNAGFNGTQGVPNGGSGGSGGTAQGGGLYGLNSTITIVNSSFVGNSALGGNGGAGGNAFTDETTGTGGKGGSGGGGQGGGLYSAAGSLQVVNTSFSTNIAQGGNGGSGGNASLFSMEKATGGAGGAGGNGEGGGLYNAAGSSQVINTTFSANTAVGENGGSGGNGLPSPPGKGGDGGAGGNGDGGGVYDSASSANSYLNNTLAFNKASAGGGGKAGNPPATAGSSGSAIGGGIFVNETAPTFVNNLLQANTAATSGPDYSGGVDSAASNNFVSNASGAATFNPASNILNNSTNQLGPLTTAANGTSYYPLMPAVVSFNSGSNSVLSTIANAEGVPVADATDQIGDPRVDPVSNIIDIGAFEFQPAPTTVTVSPVNTTFSSTSNQITLTAQVTDGDPTVDEGAITFTVTSGTGTVIGTVANVAVVNGVATTPFTIPANTPVGSYTISASYSDPFNPTARTGGLFVSSSGTGPLTIVSAGPVTVAVADPEVNFPNTDPTITLAATLTVNGAAVTEGQVQFTVAGLTSQPITVPVVNGQASVPFAVPAHTPVGTYTVAASYHDSAGNYQNGAGASTLTVLPSASTVTINAVSISYGLFSEQLTLSAVARDPNGVVINEGSVTFTDAGQTVTAPIVNGLATVTLTIPLLAENPFAHSITLGYGDSTGNFVASTSLFTLQQTILDFLLQILALEFYLQSAFGNT
jgi:hypothetical protein